MNVSDMVDSWSEAAADDVAFVAPADRSLRTAADLANHVRGSATLLSGAGIAAGGTIACMLRNGAAYAEAALGALTLGAAVAPVDTMLKGPDARDVIVAAKADAVLVDQPRALELEGMLDGVALRAKWVMAEEERAGYGRWLPEPGGQRSQRGDGKVALKLARFDYPNVNIEQRSPAELLARARGFELSGDDRVLCAAPLGSEPAIALLVAALESRVRFICAARFDPAVFWELVATHLVTVALLAPSQALDLSRAALPELATLRRMHLSGKPSFDLVPLAAYLS